MAEPYVKFLRGTPTAYNNLSTKDANTLYFVAETNATSGLLYLGTKLISSDTGGGSGGATSLSQLTDVFFNGELKNKSFLMYENGAWTNKTALDIVTMILPSFVGATSTNDGVAGLVPVPKAGDQGKFLSGDGTWVAIQGSIPQETLTTIDNLVIDVANLQNDVANLQDDVANLQDVVAGLDSTALEGRVSFLETSVGTLEQNFTQINVTVQDIDERLTWQDMDKNLEGGIN